MNLLLNVAPDLNLITIYMRIFFNEYYNRKKYILIEEKLM